YRRAFQEKGDDDALEAARALLESQQNIGIADRDRLFGYLEGGGKVILPEPQPLLTKAAKMPGLDGQKMSKSYGNTISLDASPEQVEKDMRTMPTDPARVRRTDPGNPDVCPVWQFHEIYSDDSVREWVQTGCRTAGIGCIECKQPVIDGVLGELRPMQERGREYAEQPDVVRNIINEGCERAREVARETMDEVRHAMSLDY
ncbi:MAG: tryptophan--tRNA ligase, partial [Chromatiaceae bacterium]